MNRRQCGVCIASTGAAIAIQSTVARLREAIGSAPAVPPSEGGGTDFHFGAVEYIDYESDKIPTGSFAAQFFRKRRSFKHEHELRVLLVRYPFSRTSTWITVASLPIAEWPFSRSLYLGVGHTRGATGRSMVPRVGDQGDKTLRLSIQPTQSELDATPLY